MSVADINLLKKDDFNMIDVEDAYLKVPSIIRVNGEHKEIHYFRLIIEMLNELKQMKAKICELENRAEKSSAVLTIPKLDDTTALNSIQNNGSIMFYENNDNNCKLAFKKSNGNKIHIML